MTEDMASRRAGTTLLFLVLLIGVFVPVQGVQALQESFVLTQGQGGGGGTEVETEGALFLLFPSGAQAVGLSRAMTAVQSADAAFWNPAGLAGLQGNRGVIHRGEHIIADATSAAGVLTSASTGRAVGLAYQFMDFGSQELTDGPNTPVGSISVRGHQAILSGATPLGPRLAVGLNAKYVRFEVACRGQCPDGRISGDTWATDLGLQATPLSGHPLRVGVTLAHLGPEFRVDGASSGDPLPTRLRLAASYDVFHFVVEQEELRVTLLMETEDRLRDSGSPVLLLGGILAAGTTDQILVRGGYTLGEDGQIGGAGLGLGLRYDRVELDIARTLARQGIAAQEEPVHLSLSIRF